MSNNKQQRGEYGIEYSHIKKIKRNSIKIAIILFIIIFIYTFIVYPKETTISFVCGISLTFSYINIYRIFNQTGNK